MSTVKSMTGYGAGSAQDDDYQLTVEMRSVNHRFLEVYCRMPRQLSSLEEQLKKRIGAALSRGKVDVFVTYEQISVKKPVLTVDKELAISYYKAMSEVAEQLRLPSDDQVHHLVSYPGVLTLQKSEDDLQRLALLLDAAAGQAIDSLTAMRAVEGRALAADLQARVNGLTAAAATIAAYAPQVVVEYRDKLQARIIELLGETAVDEARIVNEAAFFADKCDITEELTRLNSHLRQFADNLHLSVPVGRKLEFILQEILREINTIGSKSNSLPINDAVIDCKSELEKIREQIQNIE
ncbi:MAG: YicC/YloC family endoribonuclease [Bacillota bacterium]|nr:YicC/YloC family endoribonuclease [Bacillota bacterium]